MDDFFVKRMELDYKVLLKDFESNHGKPLKPVSRRNGKSIDHSTVCPFCGAPHDYLYNNNGGKGQFQCMVCSNVFLVSNSYLSKLTYSLG